MKNIPTFEEFSLNEKFTYDTDVTSIKSIEDFKLVLQSNYLNIFSSIRMNEDRTDLRKHKGIDFINMFKIESGKLCKLEIEKDYSPSGYTLKLMYDFINGKYYGTGFTIEKLYDYFLLVKKKGHAITFTPNFLFDKFTKDIINLRESFKSIQEDLVKSSERTTAKSVSNTVFKIGKTSQSWDGYPYIVFKMNNIGYMIELSENDFNPVVTGKYDYTSVDGRDTVYKTSSKTIVKCFDTAQDWAKEWDIFRKSVVTEARKNWVG